MKKKIVHIVESFGGGVFSYLSDLVTGTSDRYDITILYGERKQTPNNISDYFPANVKLIKINNFTRSINPIKDFKAFMEISFLLKKIKPNIVHLHSSKAGVLGRLMHYSKKQAIFYTPHGYAFLNDSNRRIIHYMYYYAEKILGMRRIMTIACSKSEYLYSLRVTHNSSYINNSININELNSFFSFDSNISDTIFTIGRIDEQKNPTLFNEIAKAMPNVKFIWFGDGQQRELLTSDNITITGWLPREILLKEIQRPKYFILTSKWEGLPISLLEAMYFKKICFVTDVPGNRDTVTDKVDGYCFTNKNQFIKSFELKDSGLGVYAKREVEKKFSTKSMIRKYINTYERYDHD